MRTYYKIALTAIMILTSSIIILFFIKNFPAHAKKPHIIVIIADDMGRNDVSFHGSNQIPTPNLDALAYNGIVLDRFYTQSICTPSRTAFLTGNYPMRSGMQGYPLKAGENRSLPLDMATIPERLKRLGYKTHLVGKWHLGSAYRRNTPTGRGYDTFFGYWNGFVGYFDYVAHRYHSNGSLIKGLDIHDHFEPAWSVQGKYATELFTEKATDVIDKHDSDVPLFLVLSHLAPHTGKDGEELGVPSITVTNTKYSYIKDPRRRLYADVVNIMDDSVGQIIKKLSQKDMLADSIILFFSDNGAQSTGMYANSGSNWPLRGLKFSDFEGGIRTAAAIYSPLFEKRGYVSKQMFHLVDWMPTFYAAAGGDLKDLGELDGINQWDVLSKNVSSSRTEILVNIDEKGNSSGVITDKGRYKLLKGTFQYDKYYGESGRGVEVPPYDPSAILKSSTNRVLQDIVNTTLTSEKIVEMRSQTDLSWCRSFNETPPIDCTEGCLFDLEKDPCETTNIIEVEGEVARRLYGRIEKFAGELVPQRNQPSDPASDPIHYNNTWCTWLDDELCFKTPDNQNRIS